MSGVIRWYPYLVESASDSTDVPLPAQGTAEIPQENRKKRISLLGTERLDFRSLVVCQQRDSRSFAKFASYLDFGRYVVKEVAESHRCFYEVIFGDTPQKPYFDLDIPLSHHVDPPRGEQGSQLDPLTQRRPDSQSSLPIGVPILPRRNESPSQPLPARELGSSRAPPTGRLAPRADDPTMPSLVPRGGFTGGAGASPALSLEEANEAVRTLTGIIRQLITPNPQADSRGQILVFTSHSDKKLSYHIIVDEWCFPDSKESRYFHDEVTKRLPAKWRDIVDHGMYKSLQQLRITGCHKWQDWRTKTLSPDLSFKVSGAQGWTSPEPPLDSNHEYLLLLGCSLVTNTSDCHLLPSFAPPEQPRKAYTRDVMTEMELDATSVDLAIELCARMGQLTPTDPNFPYRLDRCMDSRDGTALILLKRLRPSWCRVCRRIHENQHPYLLVAGRERDVYLDCRRNFENQKLYLGKLGAMARSVEVETRDWNSTERNDSGPLDRASFEDDELPMESSSQIAETPGVPAPRSLPSFHDGASVPAPRSRPSFHDGASVQDEMRVGNLNHGLHRSPRGSIAHPIYGVEDSTASSRAVIPGQYHHQIPIPCPPKDLFAQLQKASEERARPMKMELKHLSPRKGTIDSLGGWKLK